MDCNNYSYTMDFDVDNRTEAEFIDYADFGYITLSLEQWGTDRNKLQYVISGYCLINGKYEDISENYPADNTRGWETLRHAYARAAKRYNEIVPESQMIPLF